MLVGIAILTVAAPGIVNVLISGAPRAKVLNKFSRPLGFA